MMNKVAKNMNRNYVGVKADSVLIICLQRTLVSVDKWNRWGNVANNSNNIDTWEKLETFW